MPACPGPRFLPWPQVPVRGPRVGSLSPLPVVHAASLPSCSPSRPAGRPSPSVLRCLSPSSCAAADPTSLSLRKESRQKGTAARLPLCVCPHALPLGCREPPLCPEEAPAPEQILSPPANPTRATHPPPSLLLHPSCSPGLVTITSTQTRCWFSCDKDGSLWMPISPLLPHPTPCCFTAKCLETGASACCHLLFSEFI